MSNLDLTVASLFGFTDINKYVAAQDIEQEGQTIEQQQK